MRSFRANLRRLALSREDAFTIFNLPEDASKDEIKARFRDLTREMHPDKVPPDRKEQANRSYKWVAKAWDVLSGKARPGRSEIDAWLAETSRPARPADAWKQIILRVAKKHGFKPIRNTTKGDGFGMELSPNVGILVYHRGDWSAAMMSLHKWYPVTAPKLDLDEHQIEAALNELISEYKSDPLEFETRAGGVPPKNQKHDAQTQKDLERIKAIPEWDDSEFLSALVMVLERGDRLSPKGRRIIDMIVKVSNLIAKAKRQKKKGLIRKLELILASLKMGELEEADKVFIEGVDAALEEEEEETPPPKQKPSKSPSQATKVLKTLRVSPEAKDDMRVRTILSKPDPAKEAKIQARKILNLGKALRRAKAAFNIHVVTKSPEALEVAQIFVEQAMSLGWTP